MHKTDQTQNIDQADHLKEMVTEINKQQSSNLNQQEDEDTPKIDVLNLPPRKEVHKNTKKIFHISMSRPFLRFILVILLFITLFAISFFIGGIDYFDLLNS